jgi:hypothetical protein
MAAGEYFMIHLSGGFARWLMKIGISPHLKMMYDNGQLMSLR